MGIAPIHQRMAELWVINQRRPLMEHEMMELHHCLSANVKLCWEYAYLKNMSLLASMTRDVDWQHEICLDLDILDQTGNMPMKKKRPPKGDRKKL